MIDVATPADGGAAGPLRDPRAAATVRAVASDDVTVVYSPGRYEPKRLSFSAAIALFVSMGLVVFLMFHLFEVEAARKSRQAIVAVNLLPPEAPRPKPAAPSKAKQADLAKPDPVRIVAPAPLVVLPPKPLSPPTTDKPPPLTPTTTASQPAEPAPARSGPVPVNLGTRLLSGSPPKYPMESRRLREQGVVALAIVLDEDGSVAAISVQKSSGYPRLDQAALNAVRKWRWSPTIVNGAPVRVTGVYSMPFALKNSE